MTAKEYIEQPIPLVPLARYSEDNLAKWEEYSRSHPWTDEKIIIGELIQRIHFLEAVIRGQTHHER